MGNGVTVNEEKARICKVPDEFFLDSPLRCRDDVLPGLAELPPDRLSATNVVATHPSGSFSRFHGRTSDVRAALSSRLSPTVGAQFGGPRLVPVTRAVAGNAGPHQKRQPRRRLLTSMKPSASSLRT
jgi:hypothetical protein